MFYQKSFGKVYKRRCSVINGIAQFQYVSFVVFCWFVSETSCAKFETQMRNKNKKQNLKTNSSLWSFFSVHGNQALVRNRKHFPIFLSFFFQFSCFYRVHRNACESTRNVETLALPARVSSGRVSMTQKKHGENALYF
jgi:hypothetical protein